MLPTINASATISVTDPATAQTSSFPYYSIGPIDFSKLNFVRTEQTDFYYASGTTQVVSQVKQIYDPNIALWDIVLLTIGFINLFWVIVKLVKKF